MSDTPRVAEAIKGASKFHQTDADLAQKFIIDSFGSCERDLIAANKRIFELEAEIARKEGDWK